MDGRTYLTKEGDFGPEVFILRGKIYLFASESIYDPKPENITAAQARHIANALLTAAELCPDDI